MSGKRISVFGNDDALLIPRPGAISPNAAHFFVEMDSTSPIQGSFAISMNDELKLRELAPETRARLCTMFSDFQSSGNPPQAITAELMEQARLCRPLPATTRAERLLRCLYDDTTEIGQFVEYVHGEASGQKALMRSESVNGDEVRFLLQFLEERGLVRLNLASGMFLAMLTVEGLATVSEQLESTDGGQVFVAMWFDSVMEDPYREGIALGIEDAGYRPFRVDREPSLHQIDDQIIAEIRRSRFMVADFTQGDSGARGSVYYEAGFAHGLGIPVIFSCREDQLDDLHFDTRQYPHIGWTEPANLREQLRYRIEAVIGRGPRVVPE